MKVYFIAATTSEGCGHRHASVRTATPCLERFVDYYTRIERRYPRSLGIYKMIKGSKQRGVLVK